MASNGNGVAKGLIALIVLTVGVYVALGVTNQRVTRCETREDYIEKTLDRIEQKLDALLVVEGVD